jgi:excinuclease ABC subunit C
MSNKISIKISLIPENPGVYLMKDKNGKIIYVGKAKNLKSRVSSYFSGEKDLKTRYLVEKIADIETIITSSEYEALILENNLIKRHAPRYNINLKDGKSYPVIRITNEDFPRIFRTRRIVNDGSEYYGPYPNVKAVDIYIDLIHKLYPLRRCKILKNRETPCLYYHIQRCSAPCTANISKEEYNRYIKKARSLLSGRNSGFIKELEKKMKEASALQEYEKAAEYRDAVRSLEIIDTEPSVMDFNEESRDYIHFKASGRYVIFSVIKMRGGRVIDRELFINEYGGSLKDVLSEFVIQYYSERGTEIPSVIFVPEFPGDLTYSFFKDINKDLKMLIPVEKRDKSVLAMVKMNAESELERIVRKEGDLPALIELKEVLDLSAVPRRIEGFDIAQLAGKHTVASLVLFSDGKPDRAGYRHYRIHSTNNQIDDYKAISEAVARRYQRLKNENLKLPDLVLVDGGKGQVSSALKILKALGLDNKIPVAGLAKRDEEIWLPGNSRPIRLPEGDPGLRILQHVRDETHRFATEYNKKLRAKDISFSTLESVSGIGPARSFRLMKEYKSLKGIYEQKAENIARTAGVNISVAETVLELLGRTMDKQN